MKRKISKEEYDKLTPEFQALYKESGANYLLQIEGDEQAYLDMRTARDNEARLRKEAQDAAKEAQRKLDEAAAEKARADGDIKAIEAGWKKKYEDREKELLGELGKKDGALSAVMIDTVATQLSAELFITPKPLQHLVASRLRVEIEDGKPVTRVLDPKGQLSPATVDDLKKELRETPEYAPLLIGSRATGSGASNTQRGTGANGGAGKALKDMSSEERDVFYKENPEEFRRQTAALRKPTYSDPRGLQLQK